MSTLTDEEAACRAAATAAPDSAAAHAALARELERLGRDDEAEHCYRTCIRLSPEDAAYHYALGDIYLRRGSLAAAAPSFQAAVDADPHHVAAMHKLAFLADARKDAARANALFTKILTLQPGFLQARMDYMQMLVTHGRAPDAIAVGHAGAQWMDAQDAVPDDDYRKLLGLTATLLKLRGETQAAAACYRRVIARAPGDAAARHLLAALEGTLTYEHARDHARQEFDNYAATFEHRLLKDLGYRAPHILAERLWRLRPNPDALPRVLDLGCGTGLVAAELSARYRLTCNVGIDLSRAMLAEAAKRGLYHELINGDAAEVMASRSDAFDLIVAADVFIYIGDVSAIFAQAARLLTPGGILAFSVETAAHDGIELSTSGRYRHSASYIYELAYTSNLDLLRLDPGAIRSEMGQDVSGLYAYLTKN